ncbi:glycoside hydrolase family 13 protein [Spirillospora sp. NPDC052269]
MTDPWWRDAVVYQVYPRSFADANADGEGDLRGIRARLPYLKDLGVDAVWLSPFYPSPMADSGYDVADYRDVDPRYGTLADFDDLLAAATAADIKVIVDIVPNHCSSAHPWFAEALAAGPGSPERERFIFRDAPNNWQSQFGGPAWTQVADGQWYLHLFDAAQPDWNWRHPDVVALFEETLRFWLDRGVAGFRIDVADMLFKDELLPDTTPPDGVAEQLEWTPAKETPPYKHQKELFPLYRTWREILESYPGDRVMIGEIWLDDQELKREYLAGDGLDQAFNFTFMATPWDAADLRAVIGRSLPLAHAQPWALGNHDVPRAVTRLGIDQALVRNPTAEVLRGEVEVDRALGTRRARAAALLLLALPGSTYIYQGDELGLPEHLTIPDELRQDPMFIRMGGAFIGRDGCRVPMPWAGRRAPYGFADRPVDTWLPQPPDWAELTAEAQQADPGSMLTLYRQALRLRRDHINGAFAWLDTVPDADVLAFTRGEGFACVLNVGEQPVTLPAHLRVLLASEPLDGGVLPPDTAVWLDLAK